MVSRRLAALLLASVMAAACSDELRYPGKPDAAPARPDAGVTIGACRDFIASGGFDEDDWPRLWLVTDGKPDALVDTSETGFALSPDRTRVAVSSLFAVDITDLATGTRTSVPVAGRPDRIDWSLPAPLVVIDGDVWTIDPVAALGRPILGGAWTDARPSPDGQHLALIGGDGLWLRAADQAPVQVLTEVDQILGWVGPSTILAAGGGTVQRYHIGGGAETVAVLAAASDLLLSPDGLTLAYVTQGMAGPAARFLAVGAPVAEARVVTAADDIDLLSWAGTDAVLFTARSSSDHRPGLWLGGPARTALVTTGDWSAARALRDCAAPAPPP
jgi:hypothetical protein